MIVLGIDPGARWCGLAVRRGTDVLDLDILENPGELFPATQTWLRTIVGRVSALVEQHGVDLVAVESVSKPNWHMSRGGAAANPSYLLATAQALGAVQATSPVQLTEVRPGKMGSQPMGFYPEALVSAGERRRDDWRTRVGGGKLRHARSAWDVAGAGLMKHATVGA